MEVSGNVAVSVPSTQRVLQQLSIAMLKQTQEVQQAVALQLIESIPPPAGGALSSGGSLDVYA